MDFAAILEGIQLSFSFYSLLAILFGVALGQLLGAIPGLTASMAVALLIPFTFYFDPWVGIPMMLAMFKGSQFGASISAILIGTPGTPAAAATVIDGSQLAKQGKGGKALHASLVASTFGDTFSDICLIVAAGFLASIAIRFGPGEYVLLIAFSLLTLGALSGSKPWKGIVATLLGVMFGAIGLDPITGSERLTFGMLELMDGIQLIPMLIGFLAVSEVFLQMERSISSLAGRAVEFSGNKEDNKLSWREIRKLMPVMIRASSLGTMIGALPGLGATIAAFLAYNEARRVSKEPEKFGKGSLEGVVAPEAANNAVNGANMIPLLAFGIPGDVAAALILGALLIQGITPGPLAFRESAVPLYAIFSAMLMANVVNHYVGHAAIPLAKRMVTVPKRLLFPAVLVFAAAGAYAMRGSLFDVQLVFVFGLFGYLMTKLNFPPVPLLIGFILAPIMERSARQTLLLVDAADGWQNYLLSRPVLLVLIAIFLAVLMLLYRQRRRARSVAQVETQATR
jgi:putative tricarboxylic transport membrane protein